MNESPVGCQEEIVSAKVDQREYMRKWRAAHPGYNKEYQKKWQASNREKMREYWQTYKKRHPEIIKEKKKAFYKKHPEKKKEDWERWIKAHPGWQRVTNTGYLIISAPAHPRANSQGMVYAHRLVAEQDLDRYLKPNEFIHHKDEDRLNNHPENLQIVTRSEHAALHRKTKGKGENQ